MPILQIFLSEFIQSAKPDDSVQLLKLIAEMQLDTKARDIDGSTNSIPPKMVADWRDMLLVIQNKDVMSWKEQKSTRELENKTEVKEARLKLENAKKRVARAMEEHEVILDVYSQRVGIDEEDNEAE